MIEIDTHRKACHHSKRDAVSQGKCDRHEDGTISFVGGRFKVTACVHDLADLVDIGRVIIAV